MAKKPVHVFLLLGKMGALYSAGLHQYASVLKKLPGVSCSVHDYGYWHPFKWNSYHSPMVMEKARTHRIAIIGHSMGPTGASIIAEDCEDFGIPIELIFSLDCSRWSMPIPIGSNVKRVVSLCDPSHFIGGVHLVKGPGFKGQYVAENTSGISHVYYDDHPPFRERAVREVKALLAL